MHTHKYKTVGFFCQYDGTDSQEFYTLISHLNYLEITVTVEYTTSTTFKALIVFSPVTDLKLKLNV